jgi:hypothetical protein
VTPFLDTQYVSAKALPHADPFDELLLVQAQLEGLKLLTRDAKLLGHPLGIRILVPPTNRRRDVLTLGEQIVQVVQVVDGMSIGEYVVLEMTGVVSRKSFG